MQLLFLWLWVLLTLGRLMASVGIPRAFLTSGDPCLFVIPEGKLLISISGMLASLTAFDGILSVSDFRASLRKIRLDCIFSVTQNASVKFSDPGLPTLLYEEVKEKFVGVIILNSIFRRPDWP